MKMRLPLFFCVIHILMTMLFVSPLVVCGCSRETPRQQYYETAPKPKPYPGEQVQQAKNMMDHGSVLYAEAVDSDSQTEKDSLAREALDKYYYPAQRILDGLKEEYPEHEYSIDSLYQELNRRILDANKISGPGG